MAELLLEPRLSGSKSSILCLTLRHGCGAAIWAVHPVGVGGGWWGAGTQVFQQETRGRWPCGQMGAAGSVGHGWEGLSGKRELQEGMENDLSLPFTVSPGSLHG